MDELAEQVVDAINDISGRHEGHRAAHAKGTLVAGTFTGADAGLTTAAHMGHEPVRVTARFSNGGGDPAIPDYAREGRGLAVKFYLPDGSKTDVVASRRKTGSLAAAVLAAGKGERLRSDTPKVLHPVGGRPLLWHTLQVVTAARPGR